MADSTISGYAVMFGDETIIAGEFRERIAPGCFARTLRENPDVLALLSHDSGRVLGRTTAGTLTLREDRIGLWFSLEADSTTPSGQEALGTVRRQDVRGCSFGFRVRAEEWDDGGNRLPLRTIKDVDLYEITLTATPAYPTTSAALRVDSKAARLVKKAESDLKARGIRV
ncbi:HK97 family phage prohead protease [Phyllobacterium zundukense]|uniref:Phage prohead protein n=1 Tax=Phyllobacterium zundukense TaxID=1867719 RepID=A0A2N9VS51_9HYPH|nr:HK97 family phage prohead protease [Phyllobacterium zundukense]ATU92742.1 phage prohead protein [Phyllobacterium zundukense]PIO42319.1 phage prohead protein [Phyllobacterium zundukense]